MIFQMAIDKPKYLKALVSRPFLPEYFPGYEVYIWIDADAWVQDWSAIELLALGAKRKGFAIVPELFAKHSARSLRHAWIALQYSRYFHYTDFAGLEIEPLLNAGVFSGTGRSPHWSAWSRRLSQAIYNCLDILTDQFALNVAIYKDLGLDRVELLPLSCNWLANYQELLWDPRRRLWVDPSSPHTPLGIVHISGQAKEKPTHIVPTTEGFRVETYLSYPIEKLTSVKRYDYVSANQKRVNLDPCFPFLAAIDPQSHPWPHVRREVPHLWYADQRQPGIGFVSRDEAHILYNTALKLQGKNALEIGCWLGWSTAHLAAGGVILDAGRSCSGRSHSL
jgi:hypothetical protein